MLITCKECGGQVSDKAISCPHCGVPVRTKKRKTFWKSDPEKTYKKCSIEWLHREIEKIKCIVNEKYSPAAIRYGGVYMYMKCVCMNKLV